MTIGILKETGSENRVVLLPEAVETLVKLKVSILVEKGAGEKAFASDEEYQKVGAKIVSKTDIFAQSDMVLKINTLTEEEVAALKENQIVTAILNPLFDKDLVQKLLDKNITSFSLDVIPRTTRAQAMDILSSMATVSGYKAVLCAASNLPNFFPMFMSAAGTIKPTKLLILGAGVAGLQAIATSRKLGAVVEVFDVRAAVKEEVMSLGAKFVEVEGAKDEKTAGGYAVEQSDDFKLRQQQAINDHAIKSNVVICTAQIPGKKAPLLLPKSTVEQMKAGSIIIDLAASTGGNCELTKNNETVIHNGVKIIGNSFFPSEMPTDASRMFGKNVTNFLKLVIDKDGGFNLDFNDDIVKGTCVTHNKELVNERVKAVMNS